MTSISSDKVRRQVTAARIGIVCVSMLTASTWQATAQSTPKIWNKEAPVAHQYVGMWSTADGQVRHELLPNGRYDEARGSRESAYRGRYSITGNHIDYVDDTGFTADGDFMDGVLHHGGMLLYRKGNPA